MINPNRTVYCVTIGINGYMPDSRYYCATKSQAGDIAYNEAKEMRDSDYSVTGNKREGYTCTPTWTDTPLDSYIEISPLSVGELFSDSFLRDLPLAQLADTLNALD